MNLATIIILVVIIGTAIITVINAILNKKHSKVNIDITKEDLMENKELISYDKKYRNDERIMQYVQDIIQNKYEYIAVYPDHFEFDTERVNILENGFNILTIPECFVISDIFDDKTRSYIDYLKEPIMKDGNAIGHSLIKK